jgi:hypothetical protein
MRKNNFQKQSNELLAKEYAKMLSESIKRGIKEAKKRKKGLK